MRWHFRGKGGVSSWHAVFTPTFILGAAAFRALLQIRAMRKKLGPLSPTSFNPIIASQTSDSEEHSVSAPHPTGARPGRFGGACASQGQGLFI